MVSYCFIEHALCFSGGGAGGVYGIAVNPLLLERKAPKRLCGRLLSGAESTRWGLCRGSWGGGASRDITAAPPPKERQEVSRDLHIDDVFYRESN